MANELQLVTTKQIVGVLETNIAQLEKIVADKLACYNPDSYDGDVKQAKTDRAELNASKKFLADSRKQIINEYMKPVTDFEQRCKALEKNIDTVSKQVDAIVKAEEEKEKQAKRKLIEGIWTDKNFSLVSLDKMFNPKWLNKTYNLVDISKELDSAIASVYQGLQTIDQYVSDEDKDIAKSLFLETLNISDSLDHASELSKNREKARLEAEQRESRQIKEKVEQQLVEIRQENKDLNKSLAMSDMVGDALGIEVKPETKEFVLTFNGTDAQCLAVKNFLSMQGIVYTSCKELVF